MEPSSIGILAVALLLVIEVALMLLLLKVDKTLLLMPVIGIILAVIAFVLHEYQEVILSSLSAPASLALTYAILAVSVILGLFAVFIWFKGEKEARMLVSGERSIDRGVSGIESDVRGGGDELAHFDNEMSSIKTKVDEYEEREKGV